MLASLTSVLLLALSAANAALTYKGADWSSVGVEEKAGISYKNSAGAAQPLEQILKNAGVNSVRQRVWVSASGQYNLDYNLALAKRAKAQGLSVFLTLHFSDTWADPNNQKIPAGWPSDIENLGWRLYNYTLDVSNAFQKAGVPPAIVSIGNEIRGGLLFNTGKTSNWYNVGKLLNSAAYGIKDSTLSPKPKIMIHIDNGWDQGTQDWWYTSLLAAGGIKTADFDMMGVSYYPFYGNGATLSALKASLNNMASKWNKEIAVAETNWPTACASPKFEFPSDLKDIPFSAAGQSAFLKRVADIVAGVKNGKGLFYWEPAWVNNQALGSSCSSNTLFAWPGTALSSLDTFKSL
ncbi:Arabinogalactan endo-beta-1,4-galactanase [Colletotrichum sidae]|uniref:Arabinogalactan endo-beta-1,4-galactanase n=1 Tax=Colletotrichum sidae TaxID=1347389 RepID=A0A4R8T6L5_9PEZI|nr:Arabinogalactan endo-beta-1,4-galactanase [Colletotrichum sidae]